MWVCSIMFAVLISGHQRFKAHQLEWNCRTDQQKPEQAIWCLVPSLYPWHTVWVLEECVQGYEGQRGGNRVYMDLSWPLKERKGNRAEFIRLRLISGDGLPFQVHRNRDEKDRSPAQGCHQVEKIGPLHMFFMLLLQQLLVNCSLCNKLLQNSYV